MPFRKPSFTWGDVAFVIDGGGSVVVNLLQVDDDAMLCTLLPLLRWGFSHHDRRKLGIFGVVGEGELDFLGDEARVCCPSLDVDGLH